MVGHPSGAGLDDHVGATSWRPPFTSRWPVRVVRSIWYGPRAFW